MPHKLKEKFCPAPDFIREFCLEELYPQFLFRYMKSREPTMNGKDLELSTLVYVGSPSNFAVQLDTDRRISDRLSSQLARLYERPEKHAECVLTNDLLHEGIPVAARYMISDDLRWYRGIIVDIDKTPGNERPVKIRFVDYGNFQQNTRQQLMLMPIDFGNDPPLAIKCRLKGTSEGDRFPPNIDAEFRHWSTAVLKQSQCFVSFCSFDAAANQYVVRLYNSENGEEYLLPEGVAIKDEITSTIESKNVVDNLICLEADEGAASAINAAIGGRPENTTGDKRGSQMDVLRDLFDSQLDINTTSDSMVSSSGNERVRGRGADRFSQTEISMEQEAIFADEEFKELLEKYPAVTKYLKFPL